MRPQTKTRRRLLIPALVILLSACQESSISVGVRDECSFSIEVALRDGGNYGKFHTIASRQSAAVWVAARGGTIWISVRRAGSDLGVEPLLKDNGSDLSLPNDEERSRMDRVFVVDEALCRRL